MLLALTCAVRTSRRPDATRIFVDIGLGFHAELDWDEALVFCQKKEADLNRLVIRFPPYEALLFRKKEAADLNRSANFHLM